MSLKNTMYCGLMTCGLGLLAGLFASVAPADAKPRQQIAVQRAAAVSGLAASHDLRREGNRLCFLDHYHYGSSAGQTVSWSSPSGCRRFVGLVC